MKNTDTSQQYIILAHSRETFDALMTAAKLMGHQAHISILAPMTMEAAGLPGDGASVEAANSAAPRGFSVARYVSTLHHKAKVENIRVNGEPLSPKRAKLLKAVQSAGKVGIRANEVIKKYRIDHGTLSSSMRWLRDHTADGADKPLVIAQEDDERVLNGAAQPTA